MSYLLGGCGRCSVLRLWARSGLLAVCEGSTELPRMQEEGVVCYEALLRCVGAEAFTRDGNPQLFEDTWCK